MRNHKYFKFIENNLATLFLLLFYISEAFSKYSIYYGGAKSDFPRLIKSAVFALLVVFLLKFWKNLVLPSILVIMFCVGQFFLPEGFKTEIVVSVSKLLFPILIFLYFNKYKILDKNRKFLLATFETLLIFNAVLIFLGLIFEIYWFQSYTGARFGYNGVFITTASSSYIYTIGLFYFLLKLKSKFLKNWKSLLVIVSCILTGTKILYIALIVSVLLYISNYLNLRIKQRRFIFSILTAVFVLGLYFFFFKYGIFNEIRQEKGLISSIFSFRDDLLMEQSIPFVLDNWKWPNYLFGGISDLATRSQMGFFDVFYFWGAIGGILYLYAYYKEFLTFELQKTILYMLLSLIVMVFLAGNFFENATVAIYMLLLKEKIIDTTQTLIPCPNHAEDSYS